MGRCASCGAADVDGKHFCSECGAPVSLSSHPTIASPIDPTPAHDPSSQRFHPGQVFGGRYRIVAPLGRGGMGEVYRADDLKLGQPVAIKLLPRGLEQDAGLLERLRNEVRLSLRVTHPNVCRVFDIGEVDGRHFLSMEYVDGEDLASLLRRIGRLPRDKAVDVARQLCAGLAAAHDQGVLHRDLKPANVMIDGRGRAKITDFGLAGATQGIEGAEAMAGTPGYLAPEQLEGKELTVSTDIYALGILLYELFTGERAFPGENAAEVLSQQRSGTPSTSSSHSKEMDPAIESVVQRCLEKEPASRPSSALAVAAALPGGDPLAAALAAGETPSPEMVAEAGGEGSLSPAIAVPLLALVLIGLACVPFVPVDRLLDHIPLSKPPAELRLIARSIAAEVGYPVDLVDNASAFRRDLEYFEHIEETTDAADRWDDLGSVRPAPLRFWYRESPKYFIPEALTEGVKTGRPPRRISGEFFLELDPEGRLVSFEAIPPQRSEETGPWEDPNWAGLFDLAGLNLSDFESTSPVWTALVSSESRKAWLSNAAKPPEQALRVEAASFQGKTVYFQVIPGWSQPDRMVDPEESPFPVFLIIAETLVVLIITGALLLARRNRRLGRSDGRGARRLAVIFAVLVISQYFVSGHHRPTPAELGFLFESLAWGLVWAAIIWIFYSALEPYVRRLWPNLLIGWARLLEGRLRDPLVGRHILFGAVAGVLTIYLFNLVDKLSGWLGVAPSVPWVESDKLATSATWGQAAALVLNNTFPPFFFPIWTMLLLVLLRVIVRKNWLASTIFIVGLALLTQGGPDSEHLPFVVGLALGLLFWTYAWTLLTQFGLLVLMMNILFASWGSAALGAELTAWYSPPMIVLLLLLAALAIHGFTASLGGRTLFRDVLSE